VQERSRSFAGASFAAPPLVLHAPTIIDSVTPTARFAPGHDVAGSTAIREADDRSAATVSGTSASRPSPVPVRPHRMIQYA